MLDTWDDDEEDVSMGRQILPVANLPADFEGVPEDGMQYLFTVRRDARHLPHVTRAPNPYEIPDRLPPPPSSDDILPPAVHPELPTPEWRTSLETRFRNFRKNFDQPTIHVSQPARSANAHLLPDFKERDCWWAFVSGRPREEWDPPKKTKKKGQNKFEFGTMRGFSEDKTDEDASTFAGPSGTREASIDEPQPTPAETDTTTLLPAAPPPVYTPREPTPSLLRLIDQRTALHLLMYFTYWTNLHLQPGKRLRVTRTHARWTFFLLSRVEDHISADDMHMLRNLARAYLALLKSLLSGSHSKERASEEDIDPRSCWLIISTIVGVWGQRDLWMEAEEVMNPQKR
ncbi:hypothetical protein R3P38DRAFT_2832137 [Favolaschia claudopus]|uniref:Uncharacterized protein n=1 Tax=Favolaschia claudopus TaxID=2862362 RepID=A0AAW0EAC6_9AGAR